MREMKREMKKDEEEEEEEERKGKKRERGERCQRGEKKDERLVFNNSIKFTFIYKIFENNTRDTKFRNNTSASSS